MAAKRKNRLPSRILILRLLLEGHMKKIAITLIGILLAVFLAVYRPWRTGGQREKDSAGGLNAVQDSSQVATGARDVRQAINDVKQPVKRIKQRVTKAQGAKRHGKGVKPSTAGMRRDVNQRDADLEVRVIETQAVEQLTIDVTRPTEDVKMISVEFEETSWEPVYIEDMKGSSDWTPAHRVNVAVPAPQECFTPYVWVEIRGQ
jgi:hypothetical protein